MEESDRSDLDLQPGQWKMLESLFKVLEPIKTATVKLSGETYPTLCLISPELKKIRYALEPESKDSKTIVDMKKKMLKKLNEKFVKDEVTIHTIATGMDPRYKSLKTLCPEIRENVKSDIVTRLKKIIDSSNDVEGPPEKRRKLSQSDSSSDDDMALQQSSTHYQAKQEYQVKNRQLEYLKCEKCTIICNK